MLRLVAQADYNIAYLYFARGEYDRALSGLRFTHKLSEEVGDAYHVALCELDQSEIYLELNLSSDAREMAEQAVSRFRELGMGYEAGKALTNTAIAHGQEGQAFRAIELFAEARAQLVAEKNHVWPSLIDLYQAILFFDEGRYFEARRLALAALSCFLPSGLSSKAVMCHLLLARIALKTGDAHAAHQGAVTPSPSSARSTHPSSPTPGCCSETRSRSSRSSPVHTRRVRWRAKRSKHFAAGCVVKT
jgi:tetratricopeptide (TPR) repeat protein